MDKQPARDVGRTAFLWPYEPTDHSLFPTLETHMAKSKSSRQSKRKSPDCAELLVLELQEIQSAETQLARMLPRMAKAAESQKLRQMLEQRQEQGERLLKELDAAFDELEVSPGRKKNVAAEGLINDAREHIQEIEGRPALDAILLGATQKTEHYCIAAWGTAKSLAQAVGQKTVVRTMERALKGGKTFDERLTQLAEMELTPALLAEESEQESNERENQTRSRRSAGERRAST
jgi:ferritin-like metal-binding protein YciE